jgi:hypothetical protein
MMTRLTRKNLMVDADKVRELARRRGTSESEAVRQVVDFALAADEAAAIFDELAARGGIDDAFGVLDVLESTETDAAGRRAAVGDADEGGAWRGRKSPIPAS